MKTAEWDRKRNLLGSYARTLDDGEVPMTCLWLGEHDMTPDECAWLADTVARSVQLVLMADAQMMRYPE